MSQSSYAQKLRDPRWQKKRLQILERDGWFCQMCGDVDKELHVHHKFYVSRCEPWEYDDSVLVTLCWHCHERQSQFKNDLCGLLCDSHNNEALRMAGSLIEKGKAWELSMVLSHFDRRPEFLESSLLKVQQDLWPHKYPCQTVT